LYGEKVVQQLSQAGLKSGEMVRYVGRALGSDFPLIVGTLGSVVTGPVARRLIPDGPLRLACQVLFGYRALWLPAEHLEAEWSA
jgi:hypothetical protein